MESYTTNKYHISEAVYKAAKRNYQTYLEHYRARKLTPMSLEDFLENYVS